MVDRRTAASRVRRCSRATTVATYASSTRAIEVDDHDRGEALVQGGSAGSDGDRDEVAGDGDRARTTRDQGPDDERRAGDDERVGVEERARGAAGQGHDDADDGDRDGALDDEAAGPEAGGREQVVGDEDEDAADREDQQDRVL